MSRVKIIILTGFVLLLSSKTVFATDLSIKLAESEMKRKPSVTAWKYYNGFFMYSVFKLYERTDNPDYLAYVKSWADKSMVAFSKRPKVYRSLDDMYPALLMLHLYEETKEQAYLDFAMQIVTTLESYPRTQEGAFLHKVNRDGQIWLDGIYMINVFLAKYADVTGEVAYYDEVVKQISVYTDLLRDQSTGLLYHAYAEGDSPEYFDPKTKHSDEFWGRSMGWVMMTCAEVLEIMPDDYKGRNEIVKRFESLSDALLAFQDDETGMWYQVTDRADLERNWLETSSTAMFAYGMAKAVRLGLVKETYMEPALKAYDALVAYKIFKDEESLYTAIDICHGTVVGDLDYYLNRPPSDNNLRGLPAVILLADELRDHQIEIKPISEEDTKRRLIEKESKNNRLYNVLDFGVKGDSTTVNTHTLQILIERLHKEGGGTIYFPQGNYLTGALIMRSRVVFDISQGATIICSADAADFPNGKALFTAKNERNFGIVGNGSIDGSGLALRQNKEKELIHTSRFLCFENCQNIKIQDLSILAFPHWDSGLLNCTNVRIDGVSEKGSRDEYR